jgi:predicted RNA-binding Zn-ribbon protein involved in translation (DUF1610 family)
MSAEFDTRNTDDPVCPWCGQTQVNAWELFSSASWEFSETECDSCGKDILIEQQNSVSYSTRKPEPRKEGA